MGVRLPSGRPRLPTLTDYAQHAAAYDGELRLREDRGTGEVHLGKRTQWGRVVRFFRHPVRQNRADNVSANTAFLAALRQEYGNEVSRDAFRATIQNSRKPLTGRMVRKAIAEADAATDRADKAKTDLVKQHNDSLAAPYLHDESKLNLFMLRTWGLRSSHLHDKQRDYFQLQMHNHLADATASRQQLSEQEIRDLVTKVIDQALLPTGGLALYNAHYENAEMSAKRVLVELTGPGARRPAASGEQRDGDLWRDLATLTLNCARLTGAEAGASSALAATIGQRAVVQMSFTEARDLHRAAWEAQGAARKAVFALHLLRSDDRFGDGEQAGRALAQLAESMGALLKALAARTGTADSYDKLDDAARDLAKQTVPEGLVTDIEGLPVSAKVLKEAGFRDEGEYRAVMRNLITATNGLAATLTAEPTGLAG